MNLGDPVNLEHIASEAFVISEIWKMYFGALIFALGPRFECKNSSVECLEQKKIATFQSTFIF